MFNVNKNHSVKSISVRGNQQNTKFQSTLKIFSLKLD